MALGRRVARGIRKEGGPASRGTERHLIVSHRPESPVAHRHATNRIYVRIHPHATSLFVADLLGLSIEHGIRALLVFQISNIHLPVEGKVKFGLVALRWSYGRRGYQIADSAWR